jgi:hypothetical protein
VRTVTQSSTGTIDFTSLAGWTNLTFVDIAHTASQANANLQLDNFQLNAPSVPEPGSMVLMAVAGVSAIGIRRRNGRRAIGPVY